jgi:oligopeptide transport system permease protein
MSISVFRFAPWRPPVWQSSELPTAMSLPRLFSPAVIISLAVVVAMVLFVTLGPLLWQQDPSQQWLSQISRGPTPAMSVKVIKNDDAWHVSKRVTSLTVVEANTERVRLQWPNVDGVATYRVYRSLASESGIGLPMSDVNRAAFEDRLQLRHRIYRYTVTDADTGLLLFARDVRPQPAISLFEAQLQGLIKLGSAAPEFIDLPSHPLGTDALGRDMLARLMAGGQTSLFVGVVAPLLFIGLGCLIGAIAGLLGGWVDQVLMRLVDFVIALPFLLFMILFRVAFGIGPGENGIAPLILAMLMLSWPSSARLIRGQVLALRSQPFVEAARLAGVGRAGLIARHLFPNVLPMILVAFSFAIPQAIFTEAFLSFIGMGVSPPTTSWGALCNDGIKTLLSHPRQLLLPALLISISVLAFNTLGDALRDATDRRAGAVKA